MTRHDTTRHHKSGSTAWAVLSVVVLGLAVLVGCGVEETAPAPVTAEQSITITPEFRVVGMDDVGDEVFLQDLYLGIGEIRLEPLGEVDGVIYVTRSPIFLHFDLAAEQWVLRGSEMQLPHGGEYLISISLSPLDKSSEVSGYASSLQMNGLFAQTSLEGGGVDINTCDGKGCDEPMPVPLDVHNNNGQALGKRVSWVPWMYSTERPLTILLNDVSFDDASEQSLVITFDMSNWLEEAFEPIQVAVEATSLKEELVPEDNGERVEALDVSDNLDDVGAGFEELSAFTEARHAVP